MKYSGMAYLGMLGAGNEMASMLCSVLYVSGVPIAGIINVSARSSYQAAVIFVKLHTIVPSTKKAFWVSKNINGMK